MIDHPYIKYAIALIMEKCNYHSYDIISVNDIVDELKICKAEFSLKLNESLKEKERIAFVYSNEKPNWTKSIIDKESYVMASPHIASSDINSLYEEIQSIIANLEKKESSKGYIKKSLFPLGGEYLRFSDSGSVGKTYTKLMNKEIALIAITALTSKKPCRSIWTKKGKVNVCIIPDFSLDVTKDFISIFNRLEKQKSDGLFIGHTFQKSKKVCASLPRIYWGNYSNASKSSYLQALSVLGYIGELIEDADYSSKAQNVMKELEANPVHLIKPIPKSESAEIIKYNHFIIEIAKNGFLNNIIDRLYYSKLYKFKGLKRVDGKSIYKKNGFNNEEKESEYEKFDYCTSKFLTLFNHYSFNEFLSCRVEYPIEISTILTLYFLKMEQISKEIIESAEAFGAWINRCSFIAAIKESYPNKRWEELKDEEKIKVVEKKYKFLVELESSIFSSANSRSMISNIITRVGRLSSKDVPPEATLFIKAAIEPSIDTSTAKNLLIAFSRISSKGKGENLQLEETEICFINSTNI